jgi:alpha-galactosidase
MSLWALAPSPLMLGNNLPDTDEWTLSLLTNDEVLAVNQDSLGSPARRVVQTNGAEIWMKELKDGSKAIGLFNRSDAAQDVELVWNDVGLTGKQKLRDLWLHKDVGILKERYAAHVSSHGAVLLRAYKQTDSDE